MNDCIFCKIVNETLPALKIEESTDFLAFLDINPNTDGVILVIPKKHFESHLTSLDDDTTNEIMKFSKKIIEKMKLKLKVLRVGVAIEGLGVNHFHIKLYPFYGLEDSLKNSTSETTAFFNKYPGYLTTQLGPKAEIEHLKKIQEKLLN